MHIESRDDFEKRARKLAPLTSDESDQLWLLLQGVQAGAERMKRLAPKFGEEVDRGMFTATVEGDE